MYVHESPSRWRSSLNAPWNVSPFGYVTLALCKSVCVRAFRVCEGPVRYVRPSGLHKLARVRRISPFRGCE